MNYTTSLLSVQHRVAKSGAAIFDFPKIYNVNKEIYQCVKYQCCILSQNEIMLCVYGTFSHRKMILIYSLVVKVLAFHIADPGFESPSGTEAGFPSSK